MYNLWNSNGNSLLHLKQMFHKIDILLKTNKKWTINNAQRDVFYDKLH